MSPLELSYPVACSPEHAFEVWTTRLSTWWPQGHSVSHDPRTVVSLEGYVGGRLLETTSDGTVIVFGQVTEWDPPRSLSYRWHIGRDPNEATDVTIAFEDAGDGTTLLRITQDGWERLGTDAAAYRQANAGGWAALVPSYLAAVQRLSSA